ncbi:uncharacterized protein ACRADG_007424 [Cochliomyia hominivorax]
MVAIEHRSTSANTSTSILSPTSNTSVTSASTSAASTSLSTLSNVTATNVNTSHNKKMSSTSDAGTASKSAVSQRDVEVKVSKKKSSSHKDATSLELSKKVLKLDLSGKEVEEYSVKSPKSPIVGRLPHQTSLTSNVDVEDRKTLREALYQGIFHRHRRTIFAVGSFLRMLRSRNSQYNTIRSSSEGEDIDEVR